jgi:hypothetical protein
LVFLKAALRPAFLERGAASAVCLDMGLLLTIDVLFSLS